MKGQTTSLLRLFEALAASVPSATLFYDACDPNTSADEYPRITYAMARERSVRLARALRESWEVGRGDHIAVDMPNCPEFVYLLLAAAYGNFCLVTVNNRLTPDEKVERIREVARVERISEPRMLTASTVRGLLDEGADDRPNANDSWAKQAAGRFDARLPGAVMFTSGTSGKPKAAPLSFEQLTGSAAAMNAAVCTRGEGLWQLALPLYHVGGLQIIVRSLLNGNPFVLYGNFDARRVLDDARSMKATHISVVDRMLADLLKVPCDDGDVAARYRCVLLGGAAPNAERVNEAFARDIRVFAGYGMTETASAVALCEPAAEYTGELTPLPGFDLVVLAPNAEGVGSLAVKGPGVFEGYLNARTTFTGDGFFLTGDSARQVGRRVVVAERTADMFVSGGENIYPEEVRAKLLGAPGVSDAFVFGFESDEWGHRPAAFVEAVSAAEGDATDRFGFADELKAGLANRLARVYTPEHIVVVDSLPRNGVGKIDRAPLLEAFDARIQVEKVDIWRVAQPLRRPMRTAHGTLKNRESLMVRITDYRGRTGVAEGVAFSTDWYLPETIEDDLIALEETFIPALLHRALLSPDDAWELFSSTGRAQLQPMAVAALEPAVWDLYGKIVRRSLRSLIAERIGEAVDDVDDSDDDGTVPGGVVMGIMGERDTIAAVREAVDAGYTRVKMKVKPGHDIRTIKAVRREFPDLILMIDANQSYGEADKDFFRAVDEAGVACIEEPLSPKKRPGVGPRDLYDRLDRLQRGMKTPICLDESWTGVDDLNRALDHSGLRCFALKIAKLGGVRPALDMMDALRRRGADVWMGGMFDTGVSKRMHAAFGSLPGVKLPGDISDTARFFDGDVCVPPLVLTDGRLRVNPADHPYGLGCDLDIPTVERMTIEHRVYE